MKDAPAPATAHLEQERLIAEQVERAAQSIAERYRGEASLSLADNGVFNALATFALRRDFDLPGDGGEAVVQAFQINDILTEILAQGPTATKEIAEGVLGFLLLSWRDIPKPNKYHERVRQRFFGLIFLILSLIVIYLSSVSYISGFSEALQHVVIFVNPTNAIVFAAVIIGLLPSLKPLKRLGRLFSLNNAVRRGYKLMASRHSPGALWKAESVETSGCLAEGCAGCLLMFLEFIGISWLFTLFFVYNHEILALYCGFVVGAFLWSWCMALALQPRRSGSTPADELARVIADWRAEDWPAPVEGS
jgi:hypothetical protein